MTLAQSADVQISLFPDFVCVGDELVLNFDDAWRAFQSDNEKSLSNEQIAAIEKLNSRIDELSASDKNFWLEKKSLYLDSKWNELRELAKKSLDTFGWQLEIPGPSNAIYVDSKRKS